MMNYFQPIESRKALEFCVVLLGGVSVISTSLEFKHFANNSELQAAEFRLKSSRSNANYWLESEIRYHCDFQFILTASSPSNLGEIVEAYDAVCKKVSSLKEQFEEQTKQATQAFKIDYAELDWPSSIVGKGGLETITNSVEGYNNDFDEYEEAKRRLHEVVNHSLVLSFIAPYGGAIAMAMAMFLIFTRRDK